MMLTLGVAVFSMFFFLTQYLQNVRGYSAVHTGLAFLPMSAGIMVAAMTTARILTRIGIRGPLLLGPLLTFSGVLWLTQLTVTSGYLDVLGPLLLIALGMGQSFVPLTVTVMAGVAPNEAGLASALLNTGQQVGGALGLAVLGTIAISSTRHYLGAAVAPHRAPSIALLHAATVHGYTSAFEVGAAIAGAAFFISLFVLRPPRTLARTVAPVPEVVGEFS
jgi:predicted MFS family arabinose efflux permease